jgi:asparagine synthase (glutamine-hydrolysing)
VFNGEIYNHRELRHQLEQKGHRFKGHSDAEIIPYLYEDVGPKFVNLLRGMFAIAVYDLPSQSLLLTRDRFGIKPLFYAPGDDCFAFASEINALRKLPGIDLGVDRQAVYDYAALFYIPAPETFYKGIRALDAGEILEARLEKPAITWRKRRYHEWTIVPDQTITMAQAAERTEALVTEAVERQLESDVSLGCLLSGGIDSSLVSVAAQNALGGRLRTFNVRFAEKKYDETWAAKVVADHISSDHTIVDMDGERGTWARITNLLLHAGQPFSDTSLFAVNAVCRLMRQHVTVALSGDGGDEAFAGYDYYWQMARIVRLQKLPRSLWLAGAAAITPFARTGSILSRLPSRLRDLASADDVSIVQNLFCWVRENELRRLFIDQGKVEPVRRLFETRWNFAFPRETSRIERLSAFITEANVRLMLPNDFLFKVDTASMKESLEVRVPMLDEDLFAFGMSLPHRLKVQGEMCKVVLREVARRWLPASVAHKPKWGFGVPVDTWVDAEFKMQLEETLLGRRSRISEFFRPDAYRPVIEAFCGRSQCENISRTGLYQRAIMLLSVQLALDQL